MLIKKNNSKGMYRIKLYTSVVRLYHTFCIIPYVLYIYIYNIYYIVQLLQYNVRCKTFRLQGQICWEPLHRPAKGQITNISFWKKNRLITKYYVSYKTVSIIIMVASFNSSLKTNVKGTQAWEIFCLWFWILTIL